MACTTALSKATSPLRARSALTTSHHLLHLPQQQQRRHFLPNPLASSPFSAASKPQTLTATRTVPYPAAPIYRIIADVGSYAAFLPLLTSSTVTRRSSPDKADDTWPELATLTLGYSGSGVPLPITEEFTSRLYCSPATYEVEALSGPDAETSLAPENVGHHAPYPRDDNEPSRRVSALRFLRTRWTLRPFPFRPGPLEQGKSPVQHDGGAAAPPREQTEVRLSIEYAFANPIYAALGSAAAPKVADWMVRAFEERLREVLHKGVGEGRTFRGGGA